MRGESNPHPGRPSRSESGGLFDLLVAGGTKRFYRMVGMAQKLVGVTRHHVVQDVGFHVYKSKDESD